MPLTAWAALPLSFGTSAPPSGDGTTAARAGGVRGLPRAGASGARQMGLVDERPRGSPRSADQGKEGVQTACQLVS